MLSNKARRKNRRSNRFSGESLEQRQLMAADLQVYENSDNTYNTVSIISDSEPDHFQVYEENDHVVIKDVNSGQVRLALEADKLTRIYFEGHGGDDIFENLTNVPVTARGGIGNDQLTGGNGNDVLFGESGNDALFGGDGDDYLNGSFGNDVLDGEGGNDRLRGGHNNDVLDGGAGDDNLSGAAGNDILSGGVGDDYLTGYTGDDELIGGPGRDRMFGNYDNDTLIRDSDDSTVHGGSGNDTIRTAGDFSHLLDKFSAFPRFQLQKATPINQTGSEMHYEVGDYNRDGIPDLFAISKRNNGSGHTEIHVLNGADSYQSFLLHRATPLGATGDHFDFEVADWNRDGKLDVLAIKKDYTDSNTTEVHILDGASNYRTWLLKTRTALHETRGNFEFEVGDFNGDQVPDLIAIKKSNTGTNSTEVHVLDGKGNFQRWLLKKGTALHETGNNFEFEAADWNGDNVTDLVAIKKDDTATGSTEVHVLSGADNFQRFTLHSGTALHESGSNFDLAVGDWNEDGETDLIAIKKSGTSSRKTEVHVVGKTYVPAPASPTESDATVQITQDIGGYALAGGALSAGMAWLTPFLPNPVATLETIIGFHSLAYPNQSLTVAIGANLSGSAGYALTGGLGIVVSYDACSKTVQRGFYWEHSNDLGGSISVGVGFELSFTMIQGNIKTFTGKAISVGGSIDLNTPFGVGASEIFVDGKGVGFQASIGVGKSINAGFDVSSTPTTTGAFISNSSCES